MSHSMTLRGLDGSNPLAFLAALGTFRVLSVCGKYPHVRLFWQEIDGGWRPILSFTFESANGSIDHSRVDAIDDDEIVDVMDKYLRQPPQQELLKAIGPNLTITGRRLRALGSDALQAFVESRESLQCRERLATCEFVSAFGCDAITSEGDPDSTMQDTAFRTMSGAGHQHFVSFMLELIDSADASHLHKTPFQTWDYQDSGRGANMRWDPADDRRYALRWKNPSADPNMTMRGANRLAIEALPLFTTAPVARRLETTGFVQRRREGVRWTWPIWTVPVDLETCRCLLQLPEIQPLPVSASEDEQDRWRQTWARRGVAALYQSQRITIGKFRNFTPAKML